MNGAGTAYPSRAPNFSLSFCGVHVAKSLVFRVVFCRSLLVILPFFFWPSNCLSFFKFTVSDYYLQIIWYLQTFLTFDKSD